MKLLGTIQQAGPWLALRTSPNAVYPLGGSSGIASDFRETFGEAQANDIGRRLYRHSAGHLCLESIEQRDKRLASDPDNNPAWVPSVGYRVYACETCGAETLISTNHTGRCLSRCKGRCRTIIHANTARERVFPADTAHIYLKEQEQ